MWPAICTVAGLLLTYANYMAHWKYSLATASLAVGVSLFINMVLIFVGCLIAIKLLNFSLGSAQEAVLKIAAISLLPAAVSGLIEWQFGIAGGMIGWGVALLMYYTMLVIFFELDGMEVNILAGIIWLLQTWVGYILIAVILAAIMGGNSMVGSGAMGMLAGAMGGGGDGTLMDSSPTGRINKRASHYINAANSTEARAWLAGDPKRTIINWDHQQSIDAIEALYAAGSPEVYVAEIHTYSAGEMADKVVADLPDDTATRAKIVNVHKPVFANRDVGPVDHTPRQEWVIFDFDGNDEFY
jgi:hypothetical protein